MTNNIEVNAPETITEIVQDGEVLNEQEAYKKAQQINEEDKNHQAKVEDGQLKVQQVLRG